jgi:hypothetical protein
MELSIEKPIDSLLATDLSDYLALYRKEAGSGEAFLFLSYYFFIPAFWG